MQFLILYQPQQSALHQSMSFFFNSLTLPYSLLAKQPGICYLHCHWADRIAKLENMTANPHYLITVAQSCQVFAEWRRGRFADSALFHCALLLGWLFHTNS